MKTIGEFELIDHGIEHSQYFQGCGCSFTPYENVVTGIGNNPAEAIDDCLEQIACDGWEVEGMEARIIKEEGLKALPRKPEVCAGCDIVNENDTRECEGCELHYFVSIRWNEA